MNSCTKNKKTTTVISSEAERSHSHAQPNILMRFLHYGRNDNSLTNKKAGFSLTEILVSLMIVGVLTSLTIPAITKPEILMDSPWKYNGTDIYFEDHVAIGTGSTDPTYRLTIGDSSSTTDNSIIAFGQLGEGNDPPAFSSGEGRLMWIPKYAAFRAGYINSDKWDAINMGNYSVAYGYDNQASGTASIVANGEGLIASGNNSFIGCGENSTVSGDYATAGVAYNSTISGTAATAGIAYQTNVSGNYATVLAGANHDASGEHSTIVAGDGNTASGQYSVVVCGQSNTASGIASVVANGSNNSTAAPYSWVGGTNMTLPASAEGTFLWGTVANNPAVSPSIDPNRFIIWGDGVATNNRLYVKGNAQITGQLIVASNYYVDPTTGLWTLSDKRVKDIIGPYNKGLYEISQLQPYTYTYKKDKKKQVVTGVIAQDLQKVFPEAVKERKGYLSVNKDPIFYAMVNAVKELAGDDFQADIDEIEQGLQELELATAVKNTEQEQSPLFQLQNWWNNTFGKKTGKQ